MPRIKNPGSVSNAAANKRIMAELKSDEAKGDVPVSVIVKRKGKKNGSK